MKILDAGHQYALHVFDAAEPEESVLSFMKRTGENYPLNDGRRKGTNCQEVLRALIDRTEYLNRQRPCAETEAAAGLLRATLLLFELRTARRHGRHLALVSTTELLAGFCSICGHLECREHSQEGSE